jgi:DNA-binding SARP family transcriptional activator
LLRCAAGLCRGPSECRAFANLRSALARLGRTGRLGLDIGPGEICLAQGVGVDIHGARSVALHILDPATSGDDLRLIGIHHEDLAVDLLPGWYDDWALSEAENWRQLRLHTLEVLCDKLIQTRLFAGAVTAAGAAVRAEPLRESAQAALIRAHLAEGNESEALRAFRRYACLLQNELGLCPTPRLRSLVTGLYGGSRSSDGTSAP